MHAYVPTSGRPLKERWAPSQPGFSENTKNTENTKNKENMENRDNTKNTETTKNKKGQKRGFTFLCGNGGLIRSYIYRHIKIYMYICNIHVYIGT